MSGWNLRCILALVDFSEETAKVQAIATELAKMSGSHLCFLHVAPPEPDFVGYDPGPPTVRHELAAEWRGEHAGVQEIARVAREAGVDALGLQIQGAPVDAIVREAERLKADLVVAAFHPHGVLHRLAFGDTLRRLAERLPCPVIVITKDDSASRAG